MFSKGVVDGLANKNWGAMKIWNAIAYEILCRYFPVASMAVRFLGHHESGQVDSLWCVAIRKPLPAYQGETIARNCGLCFVDEFDIETQEGSLPRLDIKVVKPDAGPFGLRLRTNPANNARRDEDAWNGKRLRLAVWMGSSA